jgi:hypothetical protein
MANGILQELSSDGLAARVSLNPVEAPEGALSVRNALNRGEVVVYAPKSASAISDVIGQCFKTKFFQFAFTRENLTRPFSYVVDEAHRFITSGREDGEQSLLDRCARAYRTDVVLATQSFSFRDRRCVELVRRRSWHGPLGREEYCVANSLLLASGI